MKSILCLIGLHREVLVEALPDFDTHVRCDRCGAERIDHGPFGSPKLQGRTYRPTGPGVFPSKIPQLPSALRAPHSVVVLANDNPPDLGDVLALENELALDNEGWALLAPFGEHRKTRTVQRGAQLVEESFVQVFDEAAVTEVLANENGDGLFARIKRALIKRPIYNGHPDVKLYAPETVTLGNDKLIPLGLNEGLRKSARGLEFSPRLVPAGADAVEAGSKFPSGLFLLKKTGVTRANGDIEVRPFKLASIGLTPHPNISGVDSLANAKSNTPAAVTTEKTETDNMKQLLIGWLAAQGIALANDATEQSVFDAFLKRNGADSTSLTALGNEKTSLTATVNSLTTARDAEKKRADEAITALANEQTALKAERKSRFEAVVDLRISQGKLAVADRDGEVGKLIALGNDKIEAALTALDALPVKFQVATAISDARKATANSNAAVALANAMDVHVKAGKTKSVALDLVIKEQPALYEAYRKEGGGAL